MRFSTALLAPLLLVSSVFAQESTPREAATKFEYQSDVSRLRNIVVNSLYPTKSIFLRELLSNANDALEKLRLTSLQDHDTFIGIGELNITIRAEPDRNEQGGVGRLIVKDTGIGMTPDELKKNLGTIAKSGTSDFLSKAESSSSSSKGPDGNLIGQFGLGFYSTFLIASHVRVHSLPPPTTSNPHPKQYIFESAADGTSFEVYEDPKGNWLGERGTEIVMILKEGEKEWLQADTLKELVEKHSSFASVFPIYLQTTTLSTVPKPPLSPPTSPLDEDEAQVEEELDEPETEEVEVVSYEQLNKAEPLWMRDPKTISDEEYAEFYKVSSKDTVDPLLWSHFKADSQAGISFRALIYVPSALPSDFWHKAEKGLNNVRMMVKRVFITDDLGPQYIPRWLSFLKIHVDAEDLPLTVSRSHLTSSKFINQLQRTLIKKSLDLLSKTAENDPAKYTKLWKLVGNALKIGVTETVTDKARVAGLLRFESSRGVGLDTDELEEGKNLVGLDEYVKRRRTGQDQIYFLAAVGQKPETMIKSPFVEKLHARGYEVLLLGEPMDEICLQQLGKHEGLRFQDVTKKGLKFGDEDEEEAAAELAQLENLKEEFSPLRDWIKKHFRTIVSDVVVSTRLVSSPTAIVSDDAGMSANMQKVMAAQSNTGEEDPLLKYMKSQAKGSLEINPGSPLIRGLLARVMDLGEVGEGEVDDEEEELKAIVKTLLDVTLVRSGFDVSDLGGFFTRIESLLRQSLSISQTAQTELPKVRPAPAVSTEPLPDLNSEQPSPSGGTTAEEDAEVERLLREMGMTGGGDAGVFDEQMAGSVEAGRERERDEL